MTRGEPPASIRGLRHDLDEFIVGRGNELAYNAVCRFVHEANSAMNPLFLHGICGVGKTHLLQGFTKRFAQTHPGKSWRFTTAEQFTNEYVMAVKNNRLGDFRKRLRKLHLLVVDDVHFLANKTATQQELLHTFDTIDFSGAKLVMAGDCHPKQIRQFSDALASRFVRGMVVEVGRLEGTCKARLVEHLALKRGMMLAPTVAAAVAERCDGAGRELEGALTRLQAVAAVQGVEGPIGHAVLNQAMETRPSLETQSRPVKFEQIFTSVCRGLGVEKSSVLGSSRHKRIVLARTITIHLARQMTSMSFPELARALNKPNHSTIVTAAKRIKGQIESREPAPLLPGLEETTIDQLVARLKAAVGRDG